MWRKDELDRRFRELVWRDVPLREGDAQSEQVNNFIREAVENIASHAPELVGEPMTVDEFVAARLDEFPANVFMGTGEYAVERYNYLVWRRKHMHCEYYSARDKGESQEERKLRLVLEGVAHQFCANKDYGRIRWGVL